VKSGSNLLYLPFDKLVSQTASQPQVSDADAQTSEGASRVTAPLPQPVATDSGRGRESRDRGGR